MSADPERPVPVLLQQASVARLEGHLRGNNARIRPLSASVSSRSSVLTSTSISSPSTENQKYLDLPTLKAVFVRHAVLQKEMELEQFPEAVLDLAQAFFDTEYDEINHTDVSWKGREEKGDLFFKFLMLDQPRECLKKAKRLWTALHFKAGSASSGTSGKAIPVQRISQPANVTGRVANTEAFPGAHSRPQASRSFSSAQSSSRRRSVL